MLGYLNINFILVFYFSLLIRAFASVFPFLEAMLDKNIFFFGKNKNRWCKNVEICACRQRNKPHKTYVFYIFKPK